jgi:tRNA A-37 threonylcarbamoyl transferase component Bud32
MLLNYDVFFFTRIDGDFYEAADRRRIVTVDFVEPTLRRLPADWKHARSGFWYHCRPPGLVLPEYGWKIHLSATPSNASEVLAVATDILVRRRVQFKFAADRLFFRWLNNKRWARGGSGKFITAYPTNETDFLALLESLYEALTGYAGPYILSDRRYRDSKVVYYRYGGFKPHEQIGVDGGPQKVIRLVDGTSFVDERRPSFRLPDGVADPVRARFPPPVDTSEPGTLCGGRYRVDGALAHSNAGGIFRATDTTTGARVVIKEARPHTAYSTEGRDAIHSLLKERRILTLLESSGVAPKPVDFFQDWDHCYLVEEFVEGDTLRSYMAKRTVLLRTRPTVADVREFVAAFCELYALIADGLQIIHEHHVVFGDLSHNNILVSTDGRTVRFIDFEGSYELGVDPPPRLGTPGFSPPATETGQEPGIADDLFAYGGLLLSGIFPIAELTLLDPQAHTRFLDAWRRDFGLPVELVRLIGGLRHERPEQRPSLKEAKEVLATARVLEPPNIGYDEAEEADLADTIHGIVAFITSVMTPEREDRLFPGSPDGFAAHPASFAFGASGVAYALKRMTGRVDSEILTWILERHLSVQNCGPGLYVGAAGVAWALLELGLAEEGERALALSREHPLVWDDPDLFFGSAGVGLAHLRFFLSTHKESYLSFATEVGEHLVRSRVEQEGTCFWPKGGREYSGLGHGAAGIALYLLYLARLTGNERYLEIGCRALERVLANAECTPDGGLTWRLVQDSPTVIPSWRWGTAGVGMVLLRYRCALNTNRYDSVLDDIILDTDRKYSVFPSRQLGLAGWGEFHLDCSAFGFDADAGLERAKRVVAGVLLFGVKRAGGIAFPGETRTRLSCDFATGSAGIGHFLNRYVNGGEPAFMLDSLLRTDERPVAGGAHAGADDASVESIIAAVSQR